MGGAKMKWRLWLCFVLLLVTQITCLGQQSSNQTTKRPAQASVVTRYINALQKRDFRTLIDLTYSYQADIAQIKAQNPQVLWPKLTNEYYGNKISDFSKNPDFWGNYGEALAGMMGDPAKALRATSALLPLSSKWKITESRNSIMQNMWSGSYQATLTYVEVEYASEASSPVAEKKRITKTILQFETDLKSQLVRSVGRLAAGDEFWPIPPLTNEVAINLAPNFRQSGVGIPGLAGSDALMPYILGQGELQWPNETVTPWLDFFRQNGFTVEDTTPAGWQNTRFLKVHPPENWNRYLIGVANNPSFRLNESTDYKVVSLMQNDVAAEVKLRITFSGCSPACEVLKKFYRARLVSAQRGEQVPGFFLASYPTRVNQDQIGWPVEENGIADYVWDAGSMMWRANYFTLTSVGPLVPILEPESGPVSERATTTAPGPPSAQPSTEPQPVQQNSTAVWDKALTLGQPVTFNMCREKSFDTCEQGIFSLSVKEVSFAIWNGKKIFAVPPSEVTPVGASTSVRLKIGGKNYSFDFFPSGVTCDSNMEVYLKCPPEGMAQQRIVSSYIAQTLPKLAAPAISSATPEKVFPQFAGTWEVIQSTNDGVPQPSEIGHRIRITQNGELVRIGDRDLKITSAGTLIYKMLYAQGGQNGGHPVQTEDQADLINTATWRMESESSILVRETTFNYKGPYGGHALGTYLVIARYRRVAPE